MDFISKNRFLIIIIGTIIISCLIIKCFAIDDIENIEFTYGIVNVEKLNMRTGPGIHFDSIKILNKNEYVKILGKINNWYVIQSETNLIGAVNSKYLDLTNEQKAPSTNIEEIKETNKNDSLSKISLTEEESVLLKLVNTEREKAGLNKLEITEELENTTREKAYDLVKNNYFSHISPTYGTPFEMLKQKNITYKTASENIAGNNDIKKAFDSWMASESHKANILSNDFNYTGIAVVDSIAYGKIIVELFIGN